MQEPKKPLHHHLLDYFLPHPRNNYRPHLFSAVSIAVLVFAVIIFEGAYLVQTKYVFFNTNFLASVLPGALVALTNQDRMINGLAGVTEDALLNKAAQAAAEDMAANGYFAHISPDGKDPWYWLNQAGYTYSYAGENLAVNFTDSQNVESAWMESPTHRANIVKREYTQVGFGTANGMYEGKETTFVVEFFATPAAVEVAISAPANIAIAETSIVEATTTSTSTVQVLGTQTTEAAAAIVDAPITTSPSWLARLLASPLHTLWAIFTVLFAIIATALAITILVRVKVQHPRVLIGGTMLLALIGTSMLLSSELAGNVQLVSDTQTAAVIGAVLPN
ncbi:MAG: CAP domain-containing protein [bacterium]|nr:CAP domain-containing protein [bacterium]